MHNAFGRSENNGAQGVTRKDDEDYSEEYEGEQDDSDEESEDDESGIKSTLGFLNIYQYVSISIIYIYIAEWLSHNFIFFI